MLVIKYFPHQKRDLFPLLQFLHNLLENQKQIVPLIAETGGINAMIVDSSALLEQVTDDVIRSAFDSAGQRCSALRVLCIQEEIYEELISMIKGNICFLCFGSSSEVMHLIFVSCCTPFSFL